MIQQALQHLSKLAKAKNDNTLSDTRFIQEVMPVLDALAITSEGVTVFNKNQLVSMDYFQRKLVERVAREAHMMGVMCYTPDSAGDAVLKGELAQLIEIQAKKLLGEMAGAQ